MGMFNIGGKETKSTTTNSTSTQYSDSSANAGGDNSMAVGAGGSVNITTSDPTVVAAALHTVEANNTLSAAQYAASLNSLVGSQSVSANQQRATQDAANLAIQSSQSLAAQLAGKGPLETPESQVSIVQAVGKYAAAVAVAVAVSVALIIFSRKRKGTK